MSTNTSFRELARAITEIYQTILGEDVIADNQKSDILSAIEFLKNIENVDNFVVGNVDFPVIFYFFYLLIDVVGLVAASEGSFDPLKLGDTKLIGRKKELEGGYKGGDNSIAQHMCAHLFQGWMKNQDFFQISKDLKNVTKGKRACDFLLENKKKEKILVECKRMHPTQSFDSHDDLIINISKKSVSWIEKSLEQIKSTEEFFGEGRLERHVLLDISAFGRHYYREIEDYSIIGLLYESEISDIIKNIKEHCSVDIDCVNLCWIEVYIFQNLPRALTYRSETFSLSGKETKFKKYGGWTIELYPLGMKTNELKELRISKVDRSQAWIRASWHSCTDNLLTFGPVEHLY